MDENLNTGLKLYMNPLKNIGLFLVVACVHLSAIAQQPSADAQPVLQSFHIAMGQKPGDRELASVISPYFPVLAETNSTLQLEYETQSPGGFHFQYQQNFQKSYQN